MPSLRRAVFLDRDGVINQSLVRNGKPYPPGSPEEFLIYPDVPGALARLKAAGFLLVVVTNQPDVGRGTQSQESVEAMHRHMTSLLPIDRVEVCYDPGSPGLSTEFRKPAPGMLLRAARELGIDLASSYMVGDRWRDIDCGRAAGCVTLFIDRGYDEELRQPPHFRVGNLAEAAHIILERAEAASGQGSPGAGSPAPCTHMKRLDQLNVKIFADGADIKSMLQLYASPLIKGMTTNPTLMCKAGICDYEVFAKEVLQSVKTKPVSFEVFSDDFAEMRRQALKISRWQDNVYVKIPITNTRRESAAPLIRELGREGVKLNVTAILTLDQVQSVATALNPEVPSVVSVFAGRIADTGRDPIPCMEQSRDLLRKTQPKAELLWASVREILNIFQADACGCDIVTVPHDILNKANKLVGMDLDELSLDTVKMFAKDAGAAGFKL